MADPKVEKEAGPAPGGEIEQQDTVQPKKREYKDFGEEKEKATRKFFPVYRRWIQRAWLDISPCSNVPERPPVHSMHTTLHPPAR